MPVQALPAFEIVVLQLGGFHGVACEPHGEAAFEHEGDERIVLTFDLDFGKVVAGSGGGSISVILYRLRNKRADFVIQRLKTVLEQSTEELTQGAVVLVEDGRHRVRRMPIGK